MSSLDYGKKGIKSIKMEPKMDLVGNNDQFLMELPFYEEALNLFNQRSNDQIYADQ
jgi:hypothetical protein